MSQSPNPQGKGLVPVMDSLEGCRPQVRVPAKSIEQISNELFTSMFVLESEFKFRPVIDRPYWLYRRGTTFRLSMIGPDEWRGSAAFGEYVGECVLHPDMTWSLALCPAAAGQADLMQLIAARRAAFEQCLQAAETVQQGLPVFEATLPFYQRVFAAGLANSLAASLQRGGLAGLSYQAARARLPSAAPATDEPKGDPE
jgi:hypothetical protein